MRKKLILVLLLVLLVTGCQKINVTLPTLMIRGDIEKVINLAEIWGDVNLTKIDYNDIKIKAISIDDFLEIVKPQSNNNDIYLRASDGFTIKIDSKTMNETYLGYSPECKWIYKSLKHPVNSGIKDISEIIVVNNESDNYSSGLNIISGDNNIHYSLGELLTKPYQVINFSDGISRKDYNGSEYTVDVMQARKVFELNEFVDEEISTLLVMDERGEYEYTSNHGLIEVSDKGINLITENKTYRDIIGVMINPPQYSVTNAYDDCLYYLKKDIDVMILFVDGFSYKQYLKLKDNKNLFVSNIKQVHRANTVYKPVTNAGFAAMITGQPPKVNGVLNRSFRELRVDTIFDKAEDMNKKSILIEGDINILKTNIKPVLNIDKNSNGTKDDEIQNRALSEINKDYNLFFVHYHSVDEFGHNYGDMHPKTLDNISLIDSYINELVSSWSGKVILVSDHGMHKTYDGGSHGDFRYEDMIIPYAVFSGGKVE